MEISGSQELNVSRQRIWDSMMDPGVLAQCIPACKSIEKHSPEEFFARIRVKFGFVPIRFDLRVLLDDLAEPQGYSVVAVGQGGLVDGAKAEGRVNFIALGPDKTRAEYTGRILKGGVLLELGEPLVQKTANTWFKRFFQRFETVITSGR